ncbi:LolA family protein [Kitasatospora acidiphila]|uniref:LolA family protein n=1 Tax=Kitasatospora acidiphila TaxID=2567942 RepID=UPI003C74BE42
MTQHAGFEGPPGADEPIGVPYRARRRTALRVMVPVAVAAVAATGIAVVPALASDGAPALPQVTAEQLVTKVLSNKTQALSGTVQVNTDLGVPAELLSVAQHGGGTAGVAGTAGAAGGSGQAKTQGGSGADPTSQLSALLGGSHTLRVAADGPDKQRVALVEDLAEYDLIHNGDQAWAWDSGSQQALHYTGLRQGRPDAPGQLPGDVPSTPQQAAQRFLADNAANSDITVAGTAGVAGRSAYQLSVKPKQSGSTIGEVRIAIDSATGTPLAVTATAASGGTVFDSRFSDVSFAHPAASTWQFTPPKGAKVTEQPAGAQQRDERNKPASNGKGDTKVIGQDWTTVVSFQLPTGAAQAAGGNEQGQGKGKGHKGFGDPAELVKSLGKPVAGGTLISTKVLNVLVTDDNRVYAGAVTLPVLQAAAGVK